MNKLDSFCVTIDVDWAPDYILKYCIELLQAKNIQATIFATHRSEIFKDLDEDMFEVGLHPRVKGTFCIEKAIKRRYIGRSQTQ